MALFAYTALDATGRQMTGTIPADTRAEAMDHVLSRGLSPIAVNEEKSAVAKKSTSTRVSQSAVEAFTRELANLLAAGLPLSKALTLLRREASAPGAKNVWAAINEDVTGGTGLGDAMAKWPRVFSSVYVAMVRAGESGGFLPIVLGQIADFRTREQDLKGKMKAALVYPCVLAVFAAAVLTFLLTFFIPKFQGVFAEFGGKLPVLTQWVVAASNVMIHYGWIVALLVIGGVIAIKRSMATEAGRRMFERALLKAPALGKVTARFALVRFCRMLGTLVGSGVPLVSALRTAKESLGNQTLSDAVGYAIEEVQRGTALSKALAATPILFPASVVEMVAIAEETGRLDKELQRLSISYEGELDRNLRMLVSLAEPIMLFITAAVIGTVVVAMLLPILELQDVVK